MMGVKIMSLYAKLNKIAEQIESQLSAMQRVEAATINASVMPLVSALGYSTHDLHEVFPEYPVLDNTAAVDLAILRDSKPIILIEAKRAREKLGDKHWKQLQQYFNYTDVSFGILTNGLEYQFYADFDKPNVMDRQPFLVIDVRDLDEAAVKSLEGFTKSRFDPQTSLREWRIRRLIEQEFAQPSDDFVRHFAKQVHHGALWKEVVDEYRPVLKRELDAYIGRGQTVPPPPNGVVRVPIFAVHHSRRFQAILYVDDVMNWHKKVIIIEFEGKQMAHTEATCCAIRKLNPDAKSQPPSLQFWRFTHPVSGEEQPIKVICDDVKRGGDLRQKLAVPGSRGAPQDAPRTAM